MRLQHPNRGPRRRQRHRSGTLRALQQASNGQVGLGPRLRMPSLVDRVTRLRLRWRSTTLANIGLGFLLGGLLGIATVAGASPAIAPTVTTIPHLQPPLSPQPPRQLLLASVLTLNVHSGGSSQPSQAGNMRIWLGSMGCCGERADVILPSTTRLTPTGAPTA